MRNKQGFCLILFIIVSVIHLVAEVAGAPQILLFTKPLLMPLLAGWVWYSVGNKTAYHWTIIVGLFFSWWGDVLLMGVRINGNFFVFGLVAFLIAHIAYIRAFALDYRSAKALLYPYLKLGAWLMIGFFSWQLFHFLEPFLGDMLWPVLCYTLVISCMAIAAINRYDMASKLVWIYSTVGAICFVTSDSILAINKFVTPLPQSGFLIMSTYILAQYLIARSAVSRAPNKSLPVG